jgi:hypothetical protein
MLDSSFGFAARAAVGVAAAAFVTISAVPATAACYAPEHQVSSQTVSGFLGNPAQLLQQHPAGGGALITQIRDLAASNPATLPVILNLLANANRDQKSAIGSGLAQAARICVRTDQSFANQIQQALAATNDREAIAAYTSVTGDQPLGGIGAGPGGLGGGAGGGVAGGAVGGQTNPLFAQPNSTGGPQFIGGGSVPTGQFTLSSGVSGTGGTTTTDTTTTAAAATPVSASQ